MISNEVCDQCGGVGTTGNIVRYYENDSPEMNAEVDSSGWVACPSCSWRFAIKDSNAWTGLRHKRCGQKMSLVQ